MALKKKNTFQLTLQFTFINEYCDLGKQILHIIIKRYLVYSFGTPCMYKVVGGLNNTSWKSFGYVIIMYPNYSNFVRV